MFVIQFLHILSCVPSRPQLALLETFIHSDNSILICPMSCVALIKQCCLIPLLIFISVFPFPQMLFSHRQQMLTLSVRETREDTEEPSNDDQ